MVREGYKIKTIKAMACGAMAAVLIGLGVHAEDMVRVYVNGNRVDGNVILTDGTTYIPLRAVGEAMGAEVEWDEKSRSVFVNFTEDDAIAQIVSDVSSSVVAIIGNYDTGRESSRYNNPTVHGTGVIYKSNGHIITNAHVVKDLKNLTVVLSDGTAVGGKVLYSDETADLAVVKIDKVGLDPIRMADEADIVSGKTAIAIGTPISMSMRNTVTKGIISGSDVTLNDSYYKLIQTDATINPGNSGGPLLNTKGELIGINSSKYAGIGIENMAFAIPVDTVKYAIAQFESNGKIMRAEPDMTLEQSWEAKIGLPTVKGLTVKTSSEPGIEAGDTITAVNGIEVHSIADWNEALKDTYDGRAFSVTYNRNGVISQTEIQEGTE